MLKFPNFRYHGNKDYSLVNLNVAIKLRDLKTPLLGATCFAMSVLTSINGVIKLSTFRYHGNKGRSSVNFNEAIKLHAHENPLLHARLLAIALT